MKTPVVITSEAIQDTSKMERTEIEITKDTAVTSNVAMREKFSFWLSLRFSGSKSMESVIAPVFIRESIVDIIAAEIPTNASAPNTGGI